jgi:opacity protein-like surface antigen
MKRRKNMGIIKAALISLVLVAVTFAGDVSRKGTTGAEQLLIPVGARSIATGRAFMANITGVEAIYYNPGGLDASGKSEIMFNYMNHIADINVTYLAASAHLPDLGTVALSVKTFDFGDIPVTTFESPEGTGFNYSPSFLTLGLSYSRALTDRVSAGATVKLIYENIINATAMGVGIDFGVQYRFNPNFTMGVTVTNIGSNMQYTGTDLHVRTQIPGQPVGGPTGVYEAVTEPFQIPSFFELALAYNFVINEMNNLMLGSTYRVNNALEDNAFFGLEYGFMNTFFLRGGYNLNVQNMDDNIYGMSFGAGINYPFIEGMNIAVDYAFREVKEFPKPSHVFTVKLLF